MKRNLTDFRHLCPVSNRAEIMRVSQGADFTFSVGHIRRKTAAESDKAKTVSDPSVGEIFVTNHTD